MEKLLPKNHILDTCSLISLYATGHFDAILHCIPGQVFLASYIEKNEVKDLYNPDTDECDIPIDLTSVKENGLLRITQPNPRDEAIDAIYFTHQMSKQKPGKNTGEAITGAIAKSRKWTMVTDDIVAMQFFVNMPNSSVDITTTLHIIKHWAKSVGAPQDMIREALQRIRNYARYGPPPKAHPLLTWWQNYNITTQ